MKVIFLDFDGVICTAVSYLDAKKKYGTTHTGFAPSEHLIDTKLVARIQEICDATGAVIVLSTAWRRLHQPGEVEGYLRKHGLKAEIIGQTPEVRWGNSGSLYRGLEIERWMNEHPDVKYSDVVVLDDDWEAVSEVEEVHKRFIQTYWLNTDGEDTAGIQPADVKKAIEMLS